MCPHRQDSLFGCAGPRSSPPPLAQLHPDPTVQPGVVLSNKGLVVESLDFIVVPGIRHRRDSDLYNRWLRQLLPKDFPDSRILLFNYDALHIFGGTRLLHATRHFLDNLVEKRRHDPLRPIIFLAHSVGGIFLKYALLQAWKTPKYRSIKESAGGIVFFGTPHHGFPDDMSMEALVHLIAGRLLVPSRCLSTPYATDLLQGSGLVKLAKERLRPLEAAATVHQRWLDAYRRQLRIVSFYETVPAVVSKLEAVLGLPETSESAVPLSMSHRDMVKFSSHNDAHYQLARTYLRNLVAWVGQSAPERGDLGGRELLWFRFLYPEGLSSREDRIQDPMDGTCHWILSYPSFKKWLAPGASSVLWITGKAGSGKSTLAKFVQQSLSSSVRVSPDRSGLSFLRFFPDAWSAPKNAESVLRLMLHQAVTSHPSLLRFVARDLKQSRNWSGTLTQSLGSTLLHLAKHQSFIIIVDGLDEHGDRVGRDLIEALSEGGLPDPHRAHKSRCGCEETRSSIKFMFTSRPRFRDCKLFPSAVNLVDLSSGEAAAGVERDVRSFISGSLRLRARDAGPAQFDVLDQKLMRLVSDITERAAGVFLWVQLVVGALTQQVAPRAHRGTVRALTSVLNMPEELQGLYQLLLDNLQRDSRQLRALEWVVFAARPLKLEELQAAINIDLGLQSQLDESWPHLRHLSSIKKKNRLWGADYTQIMSPFLVVEESRVQFIHQSARDFLIPRLTQQRTTTPSAYVGATHDRCLRCCETLLLGVDDGNELARYEHPLSSYAATHWYDHLQCCNGMCIKTRSKTLRRLCSPRSRLLQTWFPVWWEEKWGEGWELARFPRYPTEGIVLAFLGNETELRSLLRQRIVRAGERTVKGEEWTPLMAAAWSGHEAVVDLLLAWHPSYKCYPRLSARALVHAIDRGHATIAQALTMAFAAATPGPTPKLRSLGAFLNGCANPLVAATRRGSLEMMKLLIDAGADVDSDGGLASLESGWSSMHWAICQGYDDVVKLLLDHGADLDSHALALACDSDDDDVVSVVLDELRRKRKADWESWDSPTLLRFATKLQNKSFVAELLELGANPALPDVFGITASQTASRNGWTDGVQLFHMLSTERSIDALMLLESCEDAIIEVVKLLLDQGISPDSSEVLTGRSAIHHVIAPRSRPFRGSLQQRLQVIRLLLDYGADVNLSDVQGETGLHLAARHGEQRIAALLLEAGADTLAKNCDQETALDLAAQKGDTWLITVLLPGGCPIRNMTWRSVLSSGNAEAVRCVLSHWRDCLTTGSSAQPEAKPALEPAPLEIAQHFVMCGDAPPRFQRAIKYLQSRHILDNPRVELNFCDKLSFTDVFKSWWEKTTSSKWYWWPFAPPIPFLTPDQAWIRWTCGTGIHQHRAKIPVDLAVDIQNLFLFQAEVDFFARPFFHGELLGDNARALVLPVPFPHSYLNICGNMLRSLSERSCRAKSSPQEPTGGWETAPQIHTILTSCKQTLVYLTGRYHNLPMQTRARSAFNELELAQRDSPVESGTPCATGSNYLPLDTAQHDLASFGEDPGPDPDPDRDPDPETPEGRRQRGRWVYVKASRSSDPKPLDVLGLHDMQFCDELIVKYMACRSYLRKYLSIMRFHHWGFDKFEQTGGGAIRSKSKGNKNEVFLPAEDVDYDFVRVETEDGGAPVSQVVFCGHYYRCERVCRVPRFMHTCSNPRTRPVPRCSDEEAGHQPPVPPATLFGEGRVLMYVPKRYEKWEPPDDGFEFAYGLTAFELPSFLGFWVYTFIAGAAAAVFWALWLTVMEHPADLQNASVPAVIFVALWVAWLRSFRDKSWNSFEEC